MTRDEITCKQKEDIKMVNSNVVDKFKELKEALRDAAYAFDKANKMANEDVNVYIELRNQLEKMFVRYTNLYAAVEKQTGHIGF